MACPRIVGLDVSPVTASSRTYRASAPVRSMTRLMLSSHRLWPSSCSRCAGFNSAPMRAIRSASHVGDSLRARDRGRFSHARPETPTKHALVMAMSSRFAAVALPVAEEYPAHIVDVDHPPQAGVVHDGQVPETAACHDLGRVADGGRRGDDRRARG